MVRIMPLANQVAIDDPRHYPVYSVCEELGSRWASTSVSPGRGSVPAVQHPELLEGVLIDFPDLVVIGAHMGHPYEELLMNYMRKWPNLYLSCTAYAPQYLDPDLVRFMNSSTYRGRMLWGSDEPWFPMRRSLTEARALPLDDDAMAQFLGGTARRLLDRTMTVRHLPPTASPDEVAAVIAEDGCAVIDRLAPLDLLDRIEVEMAASSTRRRTAPTSSRAPALAAPAGSSPDRRPRAPSSSTISCSAPATACWTHVQQYQLHLTQLIRIEPGGPAQMIHRDQWAFDFFTFPTGYQVQCNTIWAATDFTEANGATRVVPGSHLAEDKHRLDVDRHRAGGDGARLGAALRRRRSTTAAERTTRTPTASA